MTTITHHIIQLCKVALDSCLLPGTANGTEIVWLYISHWNKSLSAICFAIISIITIDASTGGDTNIITSRSVSEIENG